MDNVLLSQISNDRALASAMIFPHRHRQATPPFHVSIMDLWRSADEYVCVSAFREGAKTTLSEEFLLLEGLFHNYNYLLIFGETYTKACQRIAAMKHELVTNMKIYTLFGKQTGGGSWNENRIVLPNKVCIEAHGWEEEIRGYKYLEFRPDRAYLDDIENKQNTASSSVVDANWKKLYLELIPAMDTELGKIRFTGTPLADDCMIARAQASDRWTHGKFPICDGDLSDASTQSLWPERYSMEWIRKRRDDWAAEGLLSAFNQEYMLIAAGAQGKPFNESMLRFQDVAPRAYTPRKIIIDPARTVEVKTSDQTGYVDVSRIGTKIYVHKSGGEYWQPDAIVTGAFRLSKEADYAEVCIEKNSLDDWLLQPIRAHMLLTGQMLKVRTLNAPQDRNKAQFIMGLQPFFNAGDIILVGGRGAHPQLVSQLLNFPAGNKDVLNALAYALRVFNGVPIYGDFSEANQLSQYSLPRSAKLLLGANHSGSEMTAVLCALDGQYLTVLADWVSPLLPNEAIPDIALLIRAVYPGAHVTAWVPADVFDQTGRNPLLSALKTAGWKPQRGEHSSVSRGSLTPMLRTELRGRRLFQADERAYNTMSALAGGYNFQIRSGGERASDPEKGADRTLIEGLEALVFGMTKRDTSEQLTANSVNTLGTPYMSALPKR